jgi:dihydrofolate synthase/folylpolyglutamate synthase
MRYSNLEDWLDWQESCHPSEIDLGLARVGQVAESMALNLANCQVVTVAGTNGKGSCIASLNQLLLSAGLKVGCFTSPHFINYNERIVIDNQPVSDLLIIEAFDRIDKAREDISLSYFEFGTLAALDIFQRSELDVVLLEVGLGGRLDAVNIIDADVAVVTSIDIDHQDWLGSDREQIGLEKAGVFRPGKPALCAGHKPPDSLRDYANNIGAHFFAAGVDFDDVSDKSLDHWTWRGLDRMGETIVLNNLPVVQLPRESVSAAIQTVQLLDIPNRLIDYQSLASVTLTGRYQSLDLSGKHVILDVAHNPAAAHFLAKRIKNQNYEGKCFSLLAVMKDKDIEGIIEPLKGCFDSWFPVELNKVPRAMPAEQLANKLRQCGISDVNVCGGVEQALSEVFKLMDTNDRLFVFGSFFTVAEVVKIHRTGFYE